MKKKISILVLVCLFFTSLFAQVEPTAGNWKTWFIASGKEYKVAASPNYKNELQMVLLAQKQMTVQKKQTIEYWNAGAPGYHWVEMVYGLWMSGASEQGMLANALVNISIYDATVTAWNLKYNTKRSRPFQLNAQIKRLVQDPNSPSFPCEHSVAAGAASTIIAHFFPEMKDSVMKMAKEVMESRIAAGVAFPSDTKAGFELGKMIAEREIVATKDFMTTQKWNGKRPEGKYIWQGTPALPMAGFNKTIVLENGQQFRPAPPPDFANEMEELKKFKRGFMSTANAFFFATQSYWDDLLNKKIFEHNIHLNPPAAARLYAITAIGMYDGFTSCWDAKYAYWGTRPDQYDTSFTPAIFFTPPFPGYPSGHAMLSSVTAELYAYFFPADKEFFREKALQAAESRFQAGIHFRTDNEVGTSMGKQVAEAIINKLEKEGRFH